MKFTFIISLFSLVFLSACGATSTEQPPHSNNPPGHPPGHPPRKSLFRTDKSPTALTASKLNFMQTTQVIKAPGTLPAQHLYNINTERSRVQFQAKSPIIHSYHGPASRVPVAVSLSEDFRWNIPQVIRDQMIQQDIQHLDILFTPQLYDASPCLKAQYWMFPDLHALPPVGAPPEYQKVVLLGLYDAEDPAIENQVKINQIFPFSVSLHDGRVSPDTGHINTPSRPTSFFSLAIFAEQKRAAVTLHWILDLPRVNTLEGILQTAATRGDSFEALLNTLDADPNFSGTVLMDKLKRLVNPN